MLKRTTRLLYIHYVLLKHGLDKFLWASPLFHPIRFLKILFPWRWFQSPQFPKGEDLRKAFEELGPIYVKFGQLLSTRRDFLSDDFAQELAKLQDKVPPYSGLIAKQIIESSLKQSIESLFLEFDMTPLAAASISQVHRAKLQDGTEVVVKVLRPQIHQQVQRDIQLLESFAKWLERLVPRLRRFHPLEVVREIKTTLVDELDLMREAANASQLRRNFSQSQSLYVPKVYWEYCHKNVLVIEEIHGTPISDLDTLKSQNTDLKKLAERGVEIFFTQVFRDCFFHADMHPGNIFTCIADPNNPQYMAVDFGIMGTLSPEDQRYLGENFLAFFKRDYRKVAELHVQSGWVGPHTRVEAFEAAIRTVCEPIFEKPLKDISIGQTLLRLFQTARRYDMHIQPQLILLQKTLLAVEGLGRQLYPDLDLWQTAKPFLEKWMKQQFGLRSMITRIHQHIPVLANKLTNTPEVMQVIARLQQPAHFSHPIPAQPKNWHLSRKIFGAALLVCATLFALSLPEHPLNQWLGSLQWWVAAGLAAIGIVCIFP